MTALHELYSGVLTSSFATIKMTAEDERRLAVRRALERLPKGSNVVTVEVKKRKASK